MSDAYIQGWLPGTRGGEAITSAITGEYLFKSAGDEKNGYANTLPINWPKTENVLHNYPIYAPGAAGPVKPEIEDPLFPIGFGLATTKATDEPTATHLELN